jgi:methionyl-tRNA formyltransferase
MKLVFMGTPELAIPTLEALVKSHHEVKLVVTQPDRPAGRHLKIKPTPVKVFALKENLPLRQPFSLKEPEFIEQLKGLRPEAIIVFAYGKLIPKWLLELPRYGCLNIHASLLPKYRGAAPIQRAIMNGERVTGLTIMKMDEGLDTGDIILQKKIEILETDTSGTLAQKMANEAPKLMLTALAGLEGRRLKPQPQDHQRATLAPKIEKVEMQIDWCKPAFEIRNLIRALNPRPGAFTQINGKRLKIWSAEVVKEQADDPGTIIKIDKSKGPIVATAEQSLLLTEVQPENRAKMTGAELIRGYHLREGTKFSD